MELEKIKESLSIVQHPEFKQDIVSLGMVELQEVNEKVIVTVTFRKAKDPFAKAIERNIINTILTKFPELEGKLLLNVNKPEVAEKTKAPAEIKAHKIIAVASGKGGVGKSTVTANLAVALSRKGYKVGILDADIYGPSMPKMFGVEDYSPYLENVDGRDRIIPAEKDGIKINSIGFYLPADQALIWRGPMASNALKQLLHDTLWGELDFLLIDMPPGTGDIHLTLINEISLDGAVIVSTPQQIALADVIRGIEMFQNQKIKIPVLGMIENMAWFTPAELPENKYYIFGRDGGKQLAEKIGLKLLGQIPLVQSVCESADNGAVTQLGASGVEKYFVDAAQQIIDNL
ncbi:MAG: P-loop NTPase [Rikenellaceae bacterium]|nr:P-loop NTPase [Rikenellaceae bacterium]